MSREQSEQSGGQRRRTFLKAIPVSTLGAMMAGYIGRQDKTLRLVTGPSAYYAVVMTYVQENNILEGKLDEAGYTIEEWTETFDERPLLAGGQTDIAHPSNQEASQIAAETDTPLAISGRVTTNFLGMYVKTGSEYDPDNTGGVEETLDLVKENNATVGIGTFGGSDVPGYQVAFKAVWDENFGEEQSDYDVRGIGYAAVPNAINQGRIAMGATSPMHGAPELIMNGEIKPLFWIPEVLENVDIGIPMQYNVVSHQEYLDNHEPAVKAVVDSWEEGIDWFYDNAAEAMEDEKYFNAYDWADTVEGAKYAHNWATQSLPNEEENPSFPVMYQNPHLTDEYIEASGVFLDEAAELGLAPENWDEHISFNKLSD